MQRKRNLWPGFTFIALVAVFLWMRQQGAPLSQPATTPMGILNLEFAWNEVKLAEVKTAWQGPNIQVAQKNIYIDFLFILAYGTFLSLACAAIGKKLGGKMGNLGLQLSKAAIAAAVFDVAENSLMLLSLSQAANNNTALVTTLFAAFKFALALFCILYILIGGALSLVKPKTL
jgi:hypothetical protein